MYVSEWVSGWVDQKLVRRPGWTRGGLANTDSLYRKDYTQTVGKVQSGIKWNYWHERRRCSPSQLGNDWQWRIYSSLQYGHCGQSWLSSTTLRLNSVFMLDICWYERRHCSLLLSGDDWQWSIGTSVSVAVCILQAFNALEETNNGRLSWAMPHLRIGFNLI